MNKTGLFLIISMLFAERVNYWNLGISINRTSQRTVQKTIDINNFFAETATYQKTPNKFNESIYTLETNYLIEPTSFFIDKNIETKDANDSVKNLILNEEYFEAAKQIIYLADDKILSEFSDFDDFYYWSSFIYYNLENQPEAYNNIIMISNRENNPEILFLEALILKSIGQFKDSERILNQIISIFPNNDYANYSKNILLEK